jgi:hypothetical protein
MKKIKLAFGCFLFVSVLYVIFGAAVGSLPTVVSLDDSLADGISGSWVFLSVFGLYFWMLADYFVGRPMKARVAVGFALLFFNILAAVIYFAFVYAPRTYREI